MARLRRSRRVTGISLRRSGVRLGMVGLLGLSTLTVAAVGTFLTPEPVFGTSVPSPGTVLVTLPWGSGSGQVGLLETKEGLTQGPEALSVAPDGRIAVLDSVNRRLVLLDQGGSLLGEIALQLAQPRFLAVDDQALYVLDADSDRRVSTYEWSGKLVSTVAAPTLDDVVTGLFATSQGAFLEIAHRSVLLLGSGTNTLYDSTTTDSLNGSVLQLAGRPLDRDITQVASATYGTVDGVRITTGTVNGSSMEITDSANLRPLLAAGQPIEHLVSLDGDGHGGLLVGARLLQPGVPSMSSSTLAITRLASAGTQPADGSVLLLAESTRAYTGQPYVVAPDGRILQPFASDDGYKIMVHSFEKVQP
jgi:hypothetical protein